jgi:hypothetical protein
VPGNNVTDGTRVVKDLCRGGANTTWTLTPDGRIKGLAEKCLTLASDGYLELRTCGTGEQRFTLRGALLQIGQNFGEIKCLTRHPGSPWRSSVFVRNCDFSADQRWDIVP